MKIRLITVGKLKESFWKEAVQEYIKRLQAYAKIEIEEVEDERIEKSLSNEQIKEKEGERILSKIKPHDFVVLLDLKGAKTYDSVQFSNVLQQWIGKSYLTFVIGGSLGLGENIRARGDERWSLSPLTFPHGLTRILVLEQIYRAFKIAHHETYHK